MKCRLLKYKGGLFYMLKYSNYCDIIELSINRDRVSGLARFKFKARYLPACVTGLFQEILEELNICVSI